MSTDKFVGLDVHKDTVVVAIAADAPQPKGRGRRPTGAMPSCWRACIGRGRLEGIHVPDAADESIRDLTRALAAACRRCYRAANASWCSRSFPRRRRSTPM